MTARKYDPICSYPGCGRSHNARGLCGPHGAMQRQGEPLRPLQSRTGPIQKPVAERFWAKVDKSGECWEWVGGKTLGGYGMFGADASHRSTKKEMAHRWAYETHVGPIPPDFDIDHLCRNRACVNPKHLEAVTRAENIRRAAAYKTSCPAGHDYTEENTYFNPGTNHRKCRACSTERGLLRRDEKNARRRAKRAARGPKLRVLSEFCGKGHPLSGDNLYIPPGKTTRHCRECRKQNHEKRKAA